MSSDLLIRVQLTPNPQALKFVVNEQVKDSGKATYDKPEQAGANRMAAVLFSLPGVRQVHFFDNFITVTFEQGIDPSASEQHVCAIIQREMPLHNPHFEVEGTKAPSREHLPENIRKIEEILDKFIRPGLQRDGGDVEVVSLSGHELEVKYEGACESCPSSSMGTLMAIESILRDELDPEIVVYAV